MELARYFRFQRFAEPALERAYRHEQRAGQARYISRAIYVVLATIAVYWLSNFFRIDFSSAIEIVARQVVFVPILLGFAWLLTRPMYSEAWWVDVLFFVLVLPVLPVSDDVILATRTTGWTFPGLLTYGLQATMTCACLVFAAAVRPFFFLAALTVAFLAVVMAIRGYQAEIASYTVFNYAFFAAMIFILNLIIDSKARSAFLAKTRLAAERAKSEALLDNMLPAPVAERLKSREVIADRFDDVVVIFIDLVGFTLLSQRLGPVGIVALLNAFFERADRGTDLFGLEKVKTIGDAYMAVAGALVATPRPAKAAIDFAVWLRGQARDVGGGFGVDLRLHVGIARGPVIGGVTGTKRFTYDYWGHTVNLAARLQDSVGADGIAVSESVWQAVGDSYPFREARSVALKGVGETPVHDLALAAD